MKIIFALVIVTLFSTLFVHQDAKAQGSLTPPPGPIMPTMKSADQIEPRTIVNAVNTPGDTNDLYIISQPGSYYLTTNLVAVAGRNGIKIAANHVTLDLMGFAVLGNFYDSTSGIDIPNAQTNIIVRNGGISDWGFPGIYSEITNSTGLVFDHLNISANGYGIFTEGAAEVRNCLCNDNDDNGITFGSSGSGGLVSDCTVDRNGDFGILAAGTNAVVRNCFVQKNASGGIECQFGGVISGCTVYNNHQFGFPGVYIPFGMGHVSDCKVFYNYEGIEIASGTVTGCTVINNTSGIIIKQGTVSGCLVSTNSYSGISVNGIGCKITGNTCVGNNTANLATEAGIVIRNRNNRIEDNHVVANSNAGILIRNDVGNTNNIIIKNSVSGNGANNFIVPAGNVLGPILNDSTGAFINANPFGNFSL